LLGVKKWGMSSIQASFEPLVGIDTFDRVQDVLTGRRKTITPRQRNRSEFPLRHFVRCGYCHKPLTASRSTGKMGVKYLYYRCQNRSCPSPLNVRADAMHNGFIEFLHRQQPDPIYLRLFHKIILDVWRAKQADAVILARTVERQVDEIKERKHKLLEAMVYQQTITRSEFEEMRVPLDAELIALEENLRQARVCEVEVEKVLSFAEDLLLNVAGVWERFSLDQKQRLQEVLFPQGIEYQHGVYRTQEMSFLFRGLEDVQGIDGRFGSANGNRTRV
jgi:site-specific DNA recombinase